MQSQVATAAMTSDFSPSPHQIAPPPQSDVGYHAHNSVELSHPPTPSTLEICTDLACKPVGYHVDSFPRSLSFHSVDPLDCIVFCSTIPYSSPVVNEDQAIDGVGVMHPTYAIIHDECVWESKEKPAVKDDSLVAIPHLLHLDIPCDSSTTDFPCKNQLVAASTSYHSQDILDVSISLQCEEDTSSSKNMFNWSIIFLENRKGEHLCLSSTPLLDSSNHEEANEKPKFSNLGYHDLFTSSSNHTVDLTIFNLSKTPVYDELSVNEVKIPQTIEKIQPELIVMSGPHCPEVCFTFSQEIVETLKAPHHSLLCIEDQPNT